MKKKYIIKYSFEFIVIVLGISISFWLNELSIDNQNEKERIKVLTSLQMEIVEMRDGLMYSYNLPIKGYKKGLNLEEISSSIKIELGKTSGFGETKEVKLNFIRSILLENNIVI